MATIFRGATAVRAAIGDYLQLVVPSIIDQARTQWGLNEYELPYPEKYDAYEPYALDRWPMVGLNVTNTQDFSRVDINPDASPSFLARYRVRVFTWVRTPMDANEVPLEPEYSESIRLRDDLAACVRAAILTTGSFMQPAMVFDETTLSEEYSEATGVKGDRFVSGVIHSFDVRFDESVPLVPIGDANTITLIAQLLIDAEAGS